MQNTGTVTHEIKLVRSLGPTVCPVAAPTSTRGKLDVLAKKTGLKRLDKTTMDVQLQTGSYVLFCNVCHYQLGMHSGFKVTAK